MSWESTALYYRLLNEAARERHHGLTSARILLWSMDFQVIADLQTAGDWQTLRAHMVEAAQRLHMAGADFLAIATNTMHRLAPAIEAAVDCPLIHIGDATGKAIHQQGLRRVALLGTRYTMETPDVLTERLQAQFGLEVIVPDPADRNAIHALIFEELCQGCFTEAGKDTLLTVIARMQAAGAEGVILGCTELPLIVTQPDATLPLFDTTRLHAAAIADAIL